MKILCETLEEFKNIQDIINILNLDHDYAVVSYKYSILSIDIDISQIGNIPFYYSMDNNYFDFYNCDRSFKIYSKFDKFFINLKFTRKDEYKNRQDIPIFIKLNFNNIYSIDNFQINDNFLKSGKK